MFTYITILSFLITESSGKPCVYSFWDVKCLNFSMGYFDNITISRSLNLVLRRWCQLICH